MRISGITFARRKKRKARNIIIALFMTLFLVSLLLFFFSYRAGMDFFEFVEIIFSSLKDFVVEKI